MEFTIQHFIALAPLLITSLTIVVVMLAIAWRRNHSQTFLLSCAGLNLALLSIIPALKVAPLAVTPLMMVDDFALLYIALILVATLACVTLAHAYLGEGGTGYPGNREELYLLILLAAAGGIVLVSAQHLAGLFIGLELLSIPTYGLVAYAFFNKRSLEAGIKYMVLSAAGSAFLLFGMALLYAEAGSLSFTGIGHALAATNSPAPIAQLGLAMMLIGLAFKLSLVPFHLWTPDVYEGAPAPVAA
ncbi:proton-conducting transporter membrane subunit, partial [Pseudomonas sp. Env-66]